MHPYIKGISSTGHKTVEIKKAESAPHTPGPWYGTNTAGDHNQAMVIAEATGKTIALVYDRKNTALLTAAPEMLAALESALAQLQEEKERCDEMNLGPAFTGNLDVTIEAARSAIARAKGEA